jgi:hypothetical protein
MFCRRLQGRIGINPVYDSCPRPACKSGILGNFDNGGSSFVLHNLPPFFLSISRHLSIPTRVKKMHMLDRTYDDNLAFAIRASSHLASCLAREDRVRRRNDEPPSHTASARKPRTDRSADAGSAKATGRDDYDSPRGASFEQQMTLTVR